MRRSILSRRTMDELNRVVEEQRRAEVPFIRFIKPNKEKFRVIDMFSNVYGKLTKRAEYEVTVAPQNDRGTLVIIDDI